jgi:hypothetical protein
MLLDDELAEITGSAHGFSENVTLTQASNLKIMEELDKFY